MKLYKFKKFNEAKSSKTLERVYTQEETLEFVHKMSEMIAKNWEFYFMDYDGIEDIVQKHIGEVPLKEYLSKDEATSMEEGLLIQLLNIGYSIGYVRANIISKVKVTFQFEDFFDNLDQCLKMDQIAYNKLSWDGPEIRSSSILATTFTIKDTIKDLKRTAERYHNDSENSELLVILGKVYQYGYGIGYDISHQDFMKRMGDIEKGLAKFSDLY